MKLRLPSTVTRRGHFRNIVATFGFLYLWVALFGLLHYNYMLRKSKRKPINPSPLDLEQNRLVSVPLTTETEAIPDPIPIDENIIDSGVCKYQSISNKNLTLKMIYPDHYRRINCTKGVPSLVFRSGDLLKVNKSKLKELFKSEVFKGCKYAQVTFDEDEELINSVSFGIISDPFVDSIELEPSDEHIVVECFNNNFSAISRSYHSLIRVKEPVEKRCEEKYKEHTVLNEPPETLSVLLMGISSMSKHHQRRLMPKTKEFLLKDLQALEFNKHAVVGTTPLSNTMSLVTGLSELDLQAYWNGEGEGEQLLLSDYQKAGYRTGLLLDHLNIHKQGLLKEAVDYHYRPILAAWQTDTVVKDAMQREPCVGDVAELTQQHDFLLQFATTFNNSKTKPYFGFSYAQENLDYKTDDYYHTFFKALKDRALLNNTVIVFFSNEGMYYGDVSLKATTILDGRSPFLFLVFPSWFHLKYPHLIKVLKINQWRLTTHLDVYETLQDLLIFTGQGEMAHLGHPRISLFKEIPKERTCQHANVPRENCICNGIYLEDAAIPETHKTYCAEAVVDKINSYVAPYRTRCKYHYRDTVESIRQIRPEFVMLTQRSERGMRQALVYEVRMKTKPDYASYEAWIAFSLAELSKTNKEIYPAKILGDVRRLDPVPRKEFCIADMRSRPFCYCRAKYQRRRVRLRRRKYNFI